MPSGRCGVFAQNSRGVSRDSDFPKAAPPVTHTEVHTWRNPGMAGTAPREGAWGRTPNVAYAGSPGRHLSRQVGNRAEERAWPFQHRYAWERPGGRSPGLPGVAPDGGREYRIPQRAEASKQAESRHGRDSAALEILSVCASSTPLKLFTSYTTKRPINRTILVGNKFMFGSFD